MRHAFQLLTVVVLFAFASSASAQGGGGFNMGTMNSGGFGGSGMNSMMGSGSMNGFSSGSMNGLGSMGSGMGSGMGSSGFGSGMGGMGGFGSSSLGGTGMGQQGQQGFIGRDSSDMESIFNQLGRNSNQFMQQLNRTMNRGGRGGRSTSQEQNIVLPVRVRLEVAFERPAVQPTMVATNVRGRLEKMLTRRQIIAPNVAVVGDTVVLTGVAASDSQRLVIEKLVMLEPGVMSVENQMTVAEKPPLTPPLPPQPDN
jgi:hypothetical protein